MFETCCLNNFTRDSPVQFADLLATRHVWWHRGIVGTNLPRKCWCSGTLRCCSKRPSARSWSVSGPMWTALCWRIATILKRSRPWQMKPGDSSGLSWHPQLDVETCRSYYRSCSAKQCIYHIIYTSVFLGTSKISGASPEKLVRPHFLTDSL